MRQRSRSFFSTRVSCVAACSVLLGCGGSAPSKPAVVGPPAASATGAEAAPDLSPVAAPEALVAVGRVREIGRFADTLLSWSGMPLDWRRLLAVEQPELSELFSFEAPVDLLVALDTLSDERTPQPLAVVSVGIESEARALEFARSKGASVRKLKPGVHRVEGLGMGVCAVAVALGPSEARVVCGDRARDVDALLPYATRGFPTESLSSADVHVELMVGPVHERYARELGQLKMLASVLLRRAQLDNAKFDRALADAVYGVADELKDLAADLDKVSLAIQLKETKQWMDVRLSASFKQQSSWLAQTLASQEGRAVPTPAAFWKLPADASEAGFAVMMDSARSAKIQLTLAELLDGFLEHHGVHRSAREAFTELVQTRFDGVQLHAGGNDPEAPRSEEPSAADKVNAFLGWRIQEYAMDPKLVVQRLTRVGQALSDRALQKLLEEQVELKKLSLKKRAPRGRGLPAGSTVFDARADLTGLSFDPSGAPDSQRSGSAKAQFVTVSVLVVPRDGNTLVAVGMNENLVTAKVLEVLNSSAPGLAERKGLSPLKDQRAAAAGFATLSSFAGPYVEELSESVRSSLPHRGETPILERVDVVRGASGRLDVEFSMQVPKAVFEDLAAALPALTGNDLPKPEEPAR